MIFTALRSPKICLIVACCLGGSFGFAQTVTAPPTANEWVETLRTTLNLPGFSVSVYQNGKPRFNGTSGFASLEHQVPVSQNTSFRMGSISKILTVALGAKLAQQGSLSWKDTVKTHVPQSPVKKSSPTLAQLAAHTAGVRHYRNHDFMDCERTLTALSQDSLMYSDLEEGLGIFIKDDLLFEPGQSYSYSSYGYNLLGVALEKAGDGTFTGLLNKHVFTPLAMTGTREDHPYVIVADRADCYNIIDLKTHQPSGPSDNSYKWPSGGMVGTPTDLAKLGHAFLEPGFFKQDQLTKIFTPQPKAETKNFKVGLGWRIDEDPQGRVIYHHGGAIEGGRTFMLLIPETKTVVVMMANSFARFGLKEALELAGYFEK